MNNITIQLKNAYALFIRAASALRSPFLLFVRLYWGWQLVQNGWGKLHHLQNVTEFFASLNLPFPAQTAAFISCVEFFGGALLAAGLLSRLTALVLTMNMLAAYLTADKEALLSIFSDPDKFYAAAPYTFLIASLIVLIFGPGQIAVDTILDSFMDFDLDKQHSPF